MLFCQFFALVVSLLFGGKHRAFSNLFCILCWFSFLFFSFLFFSFLFFLCSFYSTLSKGPLPLAILAWKNSLVFHSLDKLTSLFIHIVPSTQVFLSQTALFFSSIPLSQMSALSFFLSSTIPSLFLITRFPPSLFTSQVYLVRWVLSEDFLGCSRDVCDTTFFEISVLPMGVYLVWQFLYFLKVEVFSVEKVRSKGYITSSNWMIQDPKFAFFIYFLFLLIEGQLLIDSIPRSIVNTLLPKGFQSRNSKIFGFMLIQFTFTFLALIPSWICWHSQYFHTFFLIAFIAVSIWNGVIKPFFIIIVIIHPSSWLHF